MDDGEIEMLEAIDDEAKASFTQGDDDAKALEEEEKHDEMDHEDIHPEDDLADPNNPDNEDLNALLEDKEDPAGTPLEDGEEFSSENSVQYDDLGNEELNDAFVNQQRQDLDLSADLDVYEPGKGTANPEAGKSEATTERQERAEHQQEAIEVVDLVSESEPEHEPEHVREFVESERKRVRTASASDIEDLEESPLEDLEASDLEESELEDLESDLSGESNEAEEVEVSEEIEAPEPAVSQETAVSQEHEQETKADAHADFKADTKAEPKDEAENNTVESEESTLAPSSNPTTEATAEPKTEHEKKHENTAALDEDPQPEEPEAFGLPIVVTYNSERYPLLGEKALLDSVPDHAVSLEELFAILRKEIDIPQSQEVLAHIPVLGLTIGEDNIYCREATLTDMVDLLETLDAPPSELVIELTTGKRFIYCFNELFGRLAAPE